MMHLFIRSLLVALDSCVAAAYRTVYTLGGIEWKYAKQVCILWCTGTCVTRWEIVSVASQVSSSLVSVASQGVCFMRVSCVLVASPVVSRTRMSCIESCGYAKCPGIWRSLTQCYCTLLYTQLCGTHTEFLNGIDNAQLLYHGTV
jgi:hypothetical protein